MTCRPLVMIAAIAWSAGATGRLPHPDEFNKLLLDGHYIAAEAFARNFLIDAESRSGGENADVAVALDLLIEVSSYGEQQANPETAVLAERALALKRKLFGPESAELFRTTRLYANYLFRIGRFQEARPLYEQAVHYEENTPVPDYNQLRHIWEAYAHLLSTMGDYAEAKGYLERTLAMCEKQFGPVSWCLAMSLNNLGSVNRDMGDDIAARDYFERAVVAFESKAGRGHPETVESLSNLGALLVRAGEPRRGMQLLEDALAILRKTHPADHFDVGVIQESLAVAHANVGEYVQAKPLFERAVQVIEKNYGSNHPRLAATLDKFALFLALIEETPNALSMALRAEQIGRDHLSATIRTLPERQALLFAAARPKGLHTAVMLAATHSPESPAAVLDSVIRSRALVFDELAARNRVAKDSGDPEIARLTQEVASACERLSNTVVRASTGEAYAAAVTRAREDKEQAERALAKSSAAFREDLASRRIGLQEVAAVLGPGDVLVSFVRYGWRSPPTDRLSAQLPPSYAAFVLRGSETRPAIVPIGPAREIDALVSGLREQAEAEASAPEVSPKRSEAAYRTAGWRLRRRIWDPLESYIGGASRIFIVPDGSLHMVSFAALPIGEKGYLIELGAVIHYLSTERDLAQAPLTPPGQGLLALGNPAFNRRSVPFETSAFSSVPLVAQRSAAPGCQDFSTMQFGPLPASGREVDEVAAIWKKAGGHVLELRGTAASESSFKEAASGKRVIHIAAHGFFMGEGCRKTLRRFGEPHLDNPLLYSGLALAGANQRRNGKPSEEDGIVTAEEIAAMDLGGVEWAVLSGCDTGIGEARTGEGIFGLQRAFQLAGARTVIMSLWPVDDEAARRWMKVLYRKRLLSKLDTARSVREASLTLLHERRSANLSTHPFYWASFVAAGDWR